MGQKVRERGRESTRDEIERERERVLAVNVKIHKLNFLLQMKSTENHRN